MKKRRITGGFTAAAVAGAVCFGIFLSGLNFGWAGAFSPSPVKTAAMTAAAPLEPAGQRSAAGQLAETFLDAPNGSRLHRSEWDRHTYILPAAEAVQPLDLSAFAKEDGAGRRKKEYTVMVYVCGSDLEEDGAGNATADITEMLKSRFDTSHIEVLLLTGGSKNWMRQEIPDQSYMLYRLADGELKELADLGEQDMGDPALLAGFINYGYQEFPAKKRALFLWNHGGGPMFGYGFDSVSGGELSLPEIYAALDASRAKEEALELAGFDACLMGSLETAVVFSEYAKYFIGSEEEMPQSGWDYGFLKELGREPDIDGAAFGKLIVDTYMDSGENALGSQATLSVIHTGTVGYLAEALDELAAGASDYLLNGDYDTIARARSNTKSFGVYRNDEECYDLVDIKHLAERLEIYFPKEAEQVKEALRETVAYSRRGRGLSHSSGLSVYFPFKAKQDMDLTLPVMEEIGVLPAYTSFIHDFAMSLSEGGEEQQREEPMGRGSAREAEGRAQQRPKLTPQELESLCEIYYTLWSLEEPVGAGLDYYVQLGKSGGVEIDKEGNILTEFDGRWTALNDYWVCLYELERSETEVRYAIPAYLNGQDVNLIAVYNQEYPEGRVVGAIPNETKGDARASQRMVPVAAGDTLELWHYGALFCDEECSLPADLETDVWYYTEAFLVEEELRLSMQELDEGEYMYGFLLVDTHGNESYTDFIEVDCR